MDLTDAQKLVVIDMLFTLVIGTMVLILVSSFAAMLYDKKSIKRFTKSMAEANARYDIHLTWNDVYVFKKYHNTENAKFIWETKKYVGPRKDETIDLLIDGNLVTHVSLEDTKDDWVIKSNGIELPRVKA